MSKKTKPMQKANLGDGDLSSEQIAEFRRLHVEHELLKQRAGDVRLLLEIHCDMKRASTSLEREKLLAELWDRAWLDLYALSDLGRGIVAEWDDLVWMFKQATSEPRYSNSALAFIVNRCVEIDQSLQDCHTTFGLPRNEREFVIHKMASLISKGNVWQDEPVYDEAYWRGPRAEALLGAGARP